MSKDLIQHNRPVSDSLHPRVYQSMVGLLMLYVVSVWLLFGDDSQNALVYTVVTGLFVVAIMIPFVLWRTWCRNRGRDAPEPSTTFRDWACREFDTCTGRARGSTAAVEALLPIAAVAVGMMALAFVYFLTEHGIA
jgi:hypothetical protein